MKTAKSYSIFLIAFLIINTLNLAAQDRGWIGLNIGVSSPVGQMASTNQGLINNGAATSGITLNLVDFGYAINEYVGFTACLNQSAHAVDVNKVFGGLGLSGTVKPWTFGSILAGIYVKPLEENWLHIRAMIGSSSAISPEISLYNSGGSVKINSSTSSGIAYDLGIGTIIPLGTKIGFTANLDFIGSNFNKTADGLLIDQTTTPTTISTLAVPYNLSYNMVNFNVGICYLFANKEESKEVQFRNK